VNGNSKELVRGHLIEFQKFIKLDDSDGPEQVADQYLKLVEENEKLVTICINIIDHRTSGSWSGQFELRGFDRDGAVRAAVGRWISAYIERRKEDGND
jgi:hypothetical protein